MNQNTWPPRSYSDNRPYTSLSFPRNKETHHHNRHRRYEPKPAYPNKKSTRLTEQRTTHQYDYSQLPYDVVAKIAASLKFKDLRAASLACRAWRDALAPLRESMLFLKWGKRFKHGRGGVEPNLDKALQSFLKGAARGSTLAMVDAGLVYWETGEREKGIVLFRKAAELGDPAGQCNLGISYLQGVPPCYDEAMKWLHKASLSGYVRAQYQYAICLHQGCGVERNMKEAAKWFLQAAEGGYVRAMYNTSMCYANGEGVPRSHQLARKWMKRAADCGHTKAQLDHGMNLFAEMNMMMAVVYLELASRAGETAAERVKNVIIQDLSSDDRDIAMRVANNLASAIRRDQATRMPDYRRAVASSR